MVLTLSFCASAKRSAPPVRIAARGAEILSRAVGGAIDRHIDRLLELHDQHATRHADLGIHFGVETDHQAAITACGAHGQFALEGLRLGLGLSKRRTRNERGREQQRGCEQKSDVAKPAPHTAGTADRFHWTLSTQHTHTLEPRLNLRLDPRRERLRPR